MYTDLIIVFSAPPMPHIIRMLDKAYFEKYFDRVQIWDISRIYFGEEQVKGYYQSLADLGSLEQVRVLGGEADVEAALAEVGGQSVVLDYTRRLFAGRHECYSRRLAARAGAYYLQDFSAAFMMPSVVARLKAPARIAKHRWRNRQLPVSGVLGCGRRGRRLAALYLPRSCRFVSVAHPDLRWEPGGPASERYAVFVDEAFAAEPTAALRAHQVVHDLESYRANLLAFFERVETALGLHVIVAASWKYIYPDGWFGEREVVYGRTVNLIQGCILAIGHCSTALFQTVVDRKPVALVDPGLTAVTRRRVRESARLYGVRPMASDRSDFGRRFWRDVTPRDQAALEREHLREPGVGGDWKTVACRAFQPELAGPDGADRPA